MTFLSHLSSVLSVSKSLEKELSQLTKQIHVSKNNTIVEIDSRCNDLYFVEKGLLRGFYLDDGKEITNWFAQEGEFATCFYAFVSKQPSFETIEALEDSVLTQVSFSALQQLYIQFPETERLGRIITENYYIKLEERLLSLQFKTAKERYQNFLLSKPSLLQRTSLGQIASYLGITQETLSRIRAEV
ncbi:MAG: Crp/Fnr family transcriptional regulator [Bacteroidetes bacterium]|nr:Crp/Fnr family transcriptional regulator [Bacteroidota bacterium]